jgi:hypothetical protein
MQTSNLFKLPSKFQEATLQDLFIVKPTFRRLIQKIKCIRLSIARHLTSFKQFTVGVCVSAAIFTTDTFFPLDKLHSLQSLGV